MSHLCLTNPISRRNQCRQRYAQESVNWPCISRNKTVRGHFMCELHPNIFIHQSLSGVGRGTITKRALLYGFCAVVEGSRLMNLNDLQLQLLYLHARIRRACRGERQAAAAATAVGLLPQVLRRVVRREAVIDSTWKQLLY